MRVRFRSRPRRVGLGTVRSPGPRLRGGLTVTGGAGGADMTTDFSEFANNAGIRAASWYATSDYTSWIDVAGEGLDLDTSQGYGTSDRCLKVNWAMGDGDGHAQVGWGLRFMLTSQQSECWTEVQYKCDSNWTSQGGSIVHSGTLQAATSTTATLAAAASFTDNQLPGASAVIHITGGTGSGQWREITANVGATDVITVTPAWSVTPNATSTYDIVAAPGVNNADYKFLFHSIQTGDRRDEIKLGNNGTLNGVDIRRYVGDDTIRDLLPANLNDNTWHRYRLHSKPNVSLAVCKMQVDSRSVINANPEAGGTNGGGGNVDALYLGANRNLTVLRPFNTYWGKVSVWFAGNDPGWGF